MPSATQQEFNNPGDAVLVFAAIRDRGVDPIACHIWPALLTACLRCPPGTKTYRIWVDGQSIRAVWCAEHGIIVRSTNPA